jgi:hypothetical protein
METLHIERWIVKYDSEATRKRYSQIEIGGPEACGCEPCLNFAAARERVYPDEVKRTLAELGVDYTKEEEVAHTCRIRPGLHSYIGWFRFIGRVEETTVESSDSVRIGNHLSWCFGNLAENVFSPYPLVQVDFTAEVPWVLEVKEPE